MADDTLIIIESDKLPVAQKVYVDFTRDGVTIFFKFSLWNGQNCLCKKIKKYRKYKTLLNC